MTNVADCDAGDDAERKKDPQKNLLQSLPEKRKE
jgi:hypothetical protein